MSSHVMSIHKYDSNHEFGWYSLVHVVWHRVFYFFSWILLIIIQFSPSIVERCNLTVPVGERLPRALPTTRLHTWTRIPYDDFTLLPHAADYTTTGAVSSDCIIYMAKLSCSSSELSDAYFWGFKFKPYFKVCLGPFNHKNLVEGVMSDTSHSAIRKWYPYLYMAKLSCFSSELLYFSRSNVMFMKNGIFLVPILR